MRGLIGAGDFFSDKKIAGYSKPTEEQYLLK
jgi:hypothetical protein